MEKGAREEEKEVDGAEVKPIFRLNFHNYHITKSLRFVNSGVVFAVYLDY